MNIIKFLESNESIIYLELYMWLWCAISFLIILFCYLKYNKKHKTDFKDKIYKEIPDTSTYDEIEYLLTRNITINSYLAYIYDYLYNGKMTTEIFLNPKTHKEDIRLNKTTNDDNDLNYFFSAFTQDSKINLSDLNYCNPKIINNILNKYYENKLNKVSKLNVDEQINSDFSLIYLHICIGLIAIIFLTIHEYKYLLFLLPIIILIIFISSIRRRSKNYQELYKKYLAFKKYLLKYYKYDDNIDFNKYMSYALAFGIDSRFYKSVIKHKNNKVNMNGISNDDKYNLFTNNYKIINKLRILLNKKN